MCTICRHLQLVYAHISCGTVVGAVCVAVLRRGHILTKVRTSTLMSTKGSKTEKKATHRLLKMKGGTQHRQKQVCDDRLVMMQRNGDVTLGSVVGRLQSNYSQGLSQAEAAKRLAQYGPNQLTAGKRKSIWFGGCPDRDSLTGYAGKCCLNSSPTSL